MFLHRRLGPSAQPHSKHQYLQLRRLLALPLALFPAEAWRRTAGKFLGKQETAVFAF